LKMLWIQAALTADCWQFSSCFCAYPQVCKRQNFGAARAGYFACRVRHIPLHIERGYKVHCTAPYGQAGLW